MIRPERAVGYRTPLRLPSPPAPRPWFRRLGYVGGEVACRFPPTRWRRLLVGHLRGAVARVAWVRATEWEFVAPKYVPLPADPARCMRRRLRKGVLVGIGLPAILFALASGVAALVGGALGSGLVLAVGTVVMVVGWAVSSKAWGTLFVRDLQERVRRGRLHGGQRDREGR